MDREARSPSPRLSVRLQEVERQLPERQTQLAAAQQTAAQLALSQCEQSVSSMMSELNTRWMEVTDKVQVSPRSEAAVLSADPVSLTPVGHFRSVGSGRSAPFGRHEFRGMKIWTGSRRVYRKVLLGISYEAVPPSIGMNRIHHWSMFMEMMHIHYTYSQFTYMLGEGPFMSYPFQYLL